MFGSIRIRAPNNDAIDGCFRVGIAHVRSGAVPVFLRVCRPRAWIRAVCLVAGECKALVKGLDS